MGARPFAEGHRRELRAASNSGIVCPLGLSEQALDILRVMTRSALTPLGVPIISRWASKYAARAA